MPEPDFPGFRSAAIAAARPPEYSTIERNAHTRTRRRRAFVGAALAVAVTTTGIAWKGIPRPTADSLGATPSASAPAPSDLRVRAANPGWTEVAVGDANHWYTRIAGCYWYSPTCPSWITASTDRGHTWSPAKRLPAGMGTTDLIALGPRTLLLAPGDDNSPAPLMVSLDGGTTWRTAKIDPRPMPLPKDGRVLPCGSNHPLGTSCGLLASDPASGRISPLTTQPPLKDARPTEGIATEAGIWVSGDDPATDKQAISVSHDRGRTWTTTLFSKNNVLNDSFPIASRDGKTAYAVLGADSVGSNAFLHRSDDGGRTWRRTPGAMPVVSPGAPIALLPDGAVLFSLAPVPRDGKPGAFYAITRDGGATFEELRDAARPPVYHVRTAPGGGYYVLHDPNSTTVGGEQLFTSTDGVNWTQRQLPSTT